MSFENRGFDPALRRGDIMKHTVMKGVRSTEPRPSLRIHITPMTLSLIKRFDLHSRDRRRAMRITSPLQDSSPTGEAAR